MKASRMIVVYPGFCWNQVLLFFCPSELDSIPMPAASSFPSSASIFATRFRSSDFFPKNMTKSSVRSLKYEPVSFSSTNHPPPSCNPLEQFQQIFLTLPESDAKTSSTVPGRSDGAREDWTAKILQNLIFDSEIFPCQRMDIAPAWILQKQASNCFKSNASVCRNFAILVQNRGENDNLAPTTGEPKFRLDFCPFWQNLVASSRDVSEIMFKHPGIEVVVLF